MPGQDKNLQAVYEAIAQNTPDLIYVFDLNYRFTYANAALLKMWGLTWDESIGKGLLEIGYETWHAEMHEREIDQVIATKKSIRGEVSFPHDILGRRFYDYIFAPVLDNNENVIAIAGTARDITQQVEARSIMEQSEMRFRNMVQQAPVAICVLRGEDHVVEIANEKQLQIWGKTKEQVLNKPVFRAIPEGAGLGFEELLQGVLATGKPFIATELPTTLNRNGKIATFYANFVYEPLYNSENKIDGIMSIAADVTEQVVTRQKIEKSEERFQAAIEAIQGILWTNNGKGQMEGVQRGWASLTGQTYEQYQGYGWANAVHPDDAQPTIDAWNKAVKERNTFIFEHRVKTKEGIYKDFSVRAIPILIPDGSIREWVGVHTDITKEKEQQLILLESEELFSNFGNNIQNLAWIAEGDGNIFWYNQRWLDYTGLTLDEMKGWGWRKVHHPDHVERIVEISKKLWVANEAFELTFPLRRFDGEYRWFLTRGVPVSDKNGKIYRWIGTNTDITEQKEIQDLLKESESRYRSLADNIPMISFIIEPNPEATISYWNKTWLDYTGQTYEEALGRAWDGIIHPDDVQAVLDIYVPAFESRQPYFIPSIRMKRYDGEYRWHFFKGNPRHLVNGEFLGYIGIGFDIHEQKISEDILKESEERFRSLAQTLPQLVWVTDQKGNSEFASYKWKEYTGIEHGGENEWREIVHPDDYDNINATWYNSLTTGNIYKYDVRLRNKDGEYRWHTVKGEPVFDKENKIVKWVGAFTDIHEQKIQEEKKDEFISIASHEMKTPLTTAKAYLQMLELVLDDNNEDAILYTKKASQSVHRLNELIGELLDASKIRLGKLNYTITNFDFDKMIESTVENIQLTSPTHTIIRTGNVYDKVTGDKNRLQQVVINLLNNAIKYSPGAEKVFIMVEQEGDIIKISIKDTGIGMSKNSLRKVFEKYHRIEEHAIHFQGLGIGLFISYEIIQRHQGKLWAESEPGKGSTFYFTIPVKLNSTQ